MPSKKELILAFKIESIGYNPLRPQNIDIILIDWYCNFKGWQKKINYIIRE